jgi:AraC family transcriptional regulator, ethanolamine operon transcriptional activator
MEAAYAAHSLVWTQLEPGTLEMRTSVVAAAPLEISHRRFNLGFHAEASLSTDTSLIAVLAGPRTNLRWFGTGVDGGTIAASNTFVSVRTTGSGEFYQIGVDTAGLARTFGDAPDAAALAGALRGPALTQDRDRATLLRAAIARSFSAPARIAYGTLVPLLADVLDALHRRPVEVPRSLARRFSAVRACEAYMREHIDTTISLLDLSTVAGMRSRSLINAFQAVLGLTPMSYLKCLRLNGAYRALRRADKFQTRIIDVATAWGFWHMGHFANDYRALFGEPPSQTLLNS